MSRSRRIGRSRRTDGLEPLHCGCGAWRGSRNLQFTLGEELTAEAVSVLIAGMHRAAEEERLAETIITLEAWFPLYGNPRLTRAIGYAAFCGRKNHLGVSVTLATRAWPEFPEWFRRDVLLHELAHVLVESTAVLHDEPKVGHGPEWQRVARLVGARPQATTPLPDRRSAEAVGYRQVKCFCETGPIVGPHLAGRIRGACRKGVAVTCPECGAMVTPRQLIAPTEAGFRLHFGEPPRPELPQCDFQPELFR